MTDHAAPDLGDGSIKPYLLRAIHEWAIDRNMTPQLLVDAGVEGVAVPVDCVKDGRIVLTIHPQSIRDLRMGNEYLSFSARFAGKPFAVHIPVTAVLAIYCRENGRGIIFQGDDGGKQQPTTPPRLKLVK